MTTHAQSTKRTCEWSKGDAFMLRYHELRIIRNAWRHLKQLPCRTPESDALSKDLKQRGFSFVGSLVIYAHMQAAGLVNDHLVHCFRYRQVGHPPSRRHRAIHPLRQSR